VRRLGLLCVHQRWALCCAASAAAASAAAAAAAAAIELSITTYVGWSFLFAEPTNQYKHRYHESQKANCTGGERPQTQGAVVARPAS
jgi:hypothetical protein